MASEPDIWLSSKPSPFFEGGHFSSWDLDLLLVLDHYATHKIPAIHQRLVRHPRFQGTRYGIFRAPDASWTARA